MKQKRGFYILITIFFLIIFSIMFYFNRMNRLKVQSGFEEIIRAEGLTIKSLFSLAGHYLKTEGNQKLYSFFEDLYQDENIIYLGITLNDEPVFLKSKFENYFPITETNEAFRAFKSPIGRIFEINSSFIDSQGQLYRVYLGFNYEFIVTFERQSHKNFFMVLLVLLLILTFLIIFIIKYDKRNYQQNLQYLQEKEDKEHFKELSLLTSEIAHEIKNPLNSLYLSFSTIEKDIPDNNPKTAYYKKAVKDEIQRINEIINSYSSVSKKIRTELRKVEMGGFLDDFYHQMESGLKEKNINLNIQNTINFFNTDPKLLTQVLLNLVNNAIEAQAENIVIKAGANGNKARIQIIDDGEPIDPKIRDQIFKPYTSSKTKGMGLGLHISLKILKALKGSLNLQNVEKNRKIFIITLNQGGKNE